MHCFKAYFCCSFTDWTSIHQRWTLDHSPTAFQVDLRPTNPRPARFAQFCRFICKRSCSSGGKLQFGHLLSMDWYGWNGTEKMHEYLYCRYLDIFGLYIFGKFLVAIVLTLEANFVFKVVCQLCVSSWFRSTSSQSLVNFQSDLAYPWYVETVTSETSKTDTSWISPAFLFKEIIVPFEWYGDDSYRCKGACLSGGTSNR